MNFKEYIKHDITNTFINQKEFAEIATINGVDVEIVKDDEKLVYRIQKEYEGIVVADVLFYISYDEYKKIPRLSERPETGEAVMFNGIPCTVTKALFNEGVYEIMLQYAG